MQPVGCPTRDELNGYVLGTLSQAALRQVAGHSAGCADCQRVLTELESRADDRLLAALRQSSISEPDADEPERLQFLRRASQLMSGSSPLLYFGQPVPTVDGAMAPSADQFTRNLIESKLFTEAETKQLVDSLSPEHRTDGRRLAQELVRQNKLTRYQASMIYQGRTRGFVMGNYTILDKVGAGGMGMVFKAQHRRMKRIVALKLLPPDRMKKGSTVERFQKEVEAAARLSHPHIVAAFDADQAKGVHFLVMEFVDGEDLHRLVTKRGPLPVGQAVGCVLQAARGLEHAHAAGIIHRDVTPANLLLDQTGTVKILDMGLAHSEEPADTAPQPGTEPMIVGTVDFISPEQASNPATVDLRTDIYSLGCTLYFLLTGKAIYGGESMIEKLLGHRDAPIPSLRMVRPDVPESVDAVFQRMVAKQPDDRFRTMHEVITALEACQVESDALVARPSDDEPNMWDFVDSAAPTKTRDDTLSEIVSVRPKTSRPRLAQWLTWRTLAVAIGIVAVVAAVFYFNSPSRQNGTVIVEADPEAERSIEENGITVMNVQTKRQHVLRLGPTELPAGEYQVVESGLSQKLDVDDQRFTVIRGAKLRLTVKPRVG